MLNRRQFIAMSGLGAASISLGCHASAKPAKGELPNILWITSEDNSPYLGCYGDKQALTPNLDHLATEGVRYRNAFANAPVCSAARTTLITGMHACSMGLHNHRSKNRIPEAFRYYPEYLRDAGYYCTNNSKTDYNIDRKGYKPWDASSNKAHYKNRKPGQPFFAIFNTVTSHEGQLTEKAVAGRRAKGLLPPKTRIAPEDFELPPYHADTPTVRRDWTIYYDNMTLMDKEVGDMLAELKREGLDEDTIVFYYSDHGGALPRGKRAIHDSGTRVPMIIRFPEKWAHLAPAKPGEWAEQPVGFVDFPATLLSLAGIPVPKNYEGEPFLGEEKTEPRDHVFLFRGRMDERYDTSRAIRDTRYRYIRNYNPHRPWGQQYFYPFMVLPSMGSWYEAFKKGECNAVQARYWQPKPSEEFYDTKKDPYEIKNLMDNPRQKKRIAEMRKKLRDDIIAIRDAGLIPEAMAEGLAGEKTIYDYTQSDAYPIERIVDLADMASMRDASTLGELSAALSDKHPVIRYWAAMGCLIRQKKAAPAKAKLMALLDDEWADNRVVAAEALGYLGETKAALKVIRETMEKGKPYECLVAINALNFMRDAGHLSATDARSLIEGIKLDSLSERVADCLRDTEG